MVISEGHQGLSLQGGVRTTSFDPTIAKAFGRVVRATRLSRQVAQDAFAHAASIDRSYYGKLERGERQPSLALLLRIARTLGVSGSELIAAVEAELSHTDTNATANNGDTQEAR